MPLNIGTCIIESCPMYKAVFSPQSRGTLMLNEIRSVFHPLQVVQEFIHEVHRIPIEREGMIEYDYISDFYLLQDPFRVNNNPAAFIPLFKITSEW